MGEEDMLMDNMELVRLMVEAGDRLDDIGLSKEASVVDRIMVKVAEREETDKPRHETCRWCGKVVEHPSGPNGKWCSDRCYWSDLDDRIDNSIVGESDGVVKAAQNSYDVKDIPEDPRLRGQYWSRQYVDRANLENTKLMADAARKDAVRLDKLKADNTLFAALKAKHSVQYAQTPQQLAEILRDKADMYDKKLATLQGDAEQTVGQAAGSVSDAVGSAGDEIRKMVDWQKRIGKKYNTTPEISGYDRAQKQVADAANKARGIAQGINIGDEPLNI